MAITIDEAREVVESVFDFDHVGDAMFAVRGNLDSKEAQDNLVAEIIKCAAEELDDGSPEDSDIIAAAAKERVEKFVKGSKFSQSGCSGL
jgi:putative heme degradation protein